MQSNDAAKNILDLVSNASQLGATSRQNTQQTVLHTSTQGHSLAGFRIRASVGTGGTIVTGEDKKRWRSSSKFFAKMEQLFLAMVPKRRVVFHSCFP
ncbi:hypothetical protein VTP01DRAFT_10440 [Rhizomucor pusillus]|uniref:uncharacterized protein n=1 Tax=Rhizomucor pusillus TaxID=4840 RepID=UPI00374345C5